MFSGYAHNSSGELGNMKQSSQRAQESDYKEVVYDEIKEANPHSSGCEINVAYNINK